MSDDRRDPPVDGTAPDTSVGLPLGAKIAAIAAAVALVLVLLTTVDLSGGDDDAPSSSRTFTGFDTAPTTTAPTTTAPTTR